MEFGDPSLPARFWDKVVPEPNTGCWLWTGASSAAGYGRIVVQGQIELATRFMLLRANGTIGDMALHSCQTPACVNPDHLRWGGRSENVVDSVKDGSHNMSRKTHCPQGHEYTPENTGHTNQGRSRFCRKCKNIRRGKYR